VPAFFLLNQQFPTWPVAVVMTLIARWMILDGYGRSWFHVSYCSWPCPSDPLLDGFPPKAMTIFFQPPLPLPKIMPEGPCG